MRWRTPTGSSTTRANSSWRPSSPRSTDAGRQTPKVILCDTTVVSHAKDCGAEAIAVACPPCQVNLDSRQIEIVKKDAGWRHIPVVFLSQMVGRAVGIDDKTLGLSKHLDDVTAVMA